MRLILQYLIEHPDAKDTLEGIRKWWLPAGDIPRGRDEVQSALNFLTARGWVTKRGRVLSKDIYGINKDQIQEIGRFLANARS